MSLSRSFTRSLLLLTAIVAMPLAWSQSAQVTGRVTDASGAGVPEAAITIRNQDTGITRPSVSNADGFYTVPLLPPGNYEITVDKTGFKSLRRSGVILQVDQQARLDLALEVGAQAERVEVTATAPLLESETGSLGQTIQGRQVTELPLLGRNPYALGGLVPGVRTSVGMNDLPVDQISTASASINGQRGNSNEYLLDGAPNTGGGQNQPIIFANVDSVQEFRVETNAFSAEYGRASGGVFNVITKSGTNDLHFSAYEFLRNDKLNANDFFANRAGRSRAPFRFNQFGGTIGAPIIKNRTFFFLNTELVRFVQGVTFTGTVPQPQLLTGDFSNLRTAGGQLITIYDPYTTRPNPNGAGFIRDPFPGNVIPPNRINAVAANIARYFPRPNTAGSATGNNNYALTSSNRIEKNTWGARVDHNFTDSTRFFTRVSYDDTPWTRAAPYGSDNLASPTGGPQVFTRWNSVAEASHIFSPTFLGLVRASFSRLANQRGPFSNGFDIAQLGFPAGLSQLIGAPAAFPAVNVTGYSVSSSVGNTIFGGALGSTGLINFGMNNYAVQAQATKTFTRHNLKFGGEFRIIQFNTVQTNDDSNVFSFNPAFTQGPNPSTSSATAGNALASFLLGLPTSGSVTPSPALATENNYYAFFLQDEWKVTSTLTINAGLRYDFESPRTERYNQLTNFDFNAASPLNNTGLNLRGALSFVGVNGVSRYQANPDRNNFAPRIGIAWKVTPNTVIRSGAGIFYAPTTGIGASPTNLGVSGFQASTSLVSSLDGITPLNTLSNPYPNGLNRPSGNTLGGATLLGQSLSFFDRSNRVPYTGQWNFDIQRELPGGLLVDVGYVGTRGLKLPDNRQYNQLPDSALALGDALRTQVPNPFAGQITIGPLAAATVARAQLLRPFPQYQDVTSIASNWGSSSYHALQTKIEKRFAKRFTALVSYTYSKMMDTGTGVFGGETLGGGSIQNWNNLRAEYSPSSLDQTHRLIINTVYELPFFAGQQGVLGRALGGWELGVIGSFYSGAPLGITSATNNTFSQGGGQRPNWTGVNPKLDNPSPNLWFDTTQFSNPPAYQFGNVSRTLGGLRGDSARQVDVSLHKNTRLTEKMTLQFRAEAFNLANTVRFAPPNTSFGNAQFGVVASQLNQPRVLQFGLKLMR